MSLFGCADSASSKQKKRIYQNIDQNDDQDEAPLLVSPYDQANLFQVYTLAYMLPLFRKSRRKQLTLRDIGPPPRVDASRALGSRLQQAYNGEILNGRSPSLIRCLFKVFGPQLLLLSFLDFFSKCIGYPMQTIALGWLIRDAGIYLSFALPPVQPLEAADTVMTPLNATTTTTTTTTPIPALPPIGAAAGLTANEAYWRIIYDAVILMLVQMLAIVMAHPFFFQTYHIGMKCRVASCFLIYKKSLRLSQAAMSETTVGQMVNLLSNDVNRFDNVCQMLPYLVLAPLQALIVLAILSLFYLGVYPTLASLATIVFYVLVQSLMGRGFSKYRAKTARRTDERVRLMNEIILAMKIIKMYAWERPFKALVYSARRREITTIGIASILRVINQTLFFTSSKIIVFVALIVYVSLGNSLNPEILFVTIGLANLVRISLTLFFPNAIAYVAETIVSCRRISTFLALPEIEQASSLYRVSPDALGCKHVLSMSKVYATWSSPKQQQQQQKQQATNKSTTSSDDLAMPSNQTAQRGWAVLRNLTLAIKPRDLVLIVGRVGSGKSSVLMSLLGELPLTSGRLEINGRVSYASQEAWIFSGTVRDNILFGKPMDQERYQRVIRVCSLQRDLEILIEGDLTIVGERGVSLSGGQKARVNLARALYQEADIYLLDDPLAAVDAPVAKHIFNESLKSFLRKKTVLLATHQLQFLRHATKVLIVDRNAPAVFGSLQEVMESEAFAVVGYSMEAFRDATTTATETDQDGARDTSPSSGSNAASTSGSQSPTSKNLQQQQQQQQQQPAQTQPPAGVRDSSSSRPVRAESQASSNSAESLKQLSSPIVSLELEKRSPDLELDDAPVEQKMLLVAMKKPSAPTNKGSSRRQGAELLSDISSNFQTYLYYLSNATGLLMFIWFVLANVLTQTLYQYTDYFLSFWTDSVQRKEYQGAQFVPVTFVDSLTTGQTSAIYGGLVAFLLFATLVRSATFFAGTLRASINIHEKFANCIIRAPMTFFDFSPIGILLNRLSRDIGFVDETLPATAIEIVTIFVNIIGIMILAILLNVINLISTLMLMVLVVYARTICASTIARLKQIEGVTKSPIFSHLSTTLSGLATIRAFRVQDEFVRMFNKHQDAHSSAWFNYISSGRWLAVALDWCCLFFITTVISFLLAFSLDAQNASLVGLLISQVIIVPGPLQWGTRQMIEVESQMTSVQRIKEFSELTSEEELMAGSGRKKSRSESGSSSSSTSGRSSSSSAHPKQEREREREQLVSTGYQSGRIATPPPIKLAEGEIKFSNVTLNYFPEEPPVLKALSFTIKAGEKVGVVGRTGAGKSSVVSVLFRLYDFAGTIRIDGRDTRSVPLADLRQTMSIIPQDPVLFGGTIRKNLDPFGDFSDARLWDALEAVHLRQLFACHPTGLEFAISEGGSNFSVGQRQLICLARAIVRRNKILILDEATANVDPETDMFIQRTIARQFQQCTVLTIAHRLITIVDSDRVLVLDRGEISEFGAPKELLKLEGGLFKQMVDSSGQQAGRLVRLIGEAHERRRQQQQQQQPPSPSPSTSRSTPSTSGALE